MMMVEVVDHVASLKNILYRFQVDVKCTNRDSKDSGPSFLLHHLVSYSQILIDYHLENKSLMMTTVHIVVVLAVAEDDVDGMDEMDFVVVVVEHLVEVVLVDILQQDWEDIHSKGSTVPDHLPVMSVS